MKIIKIVTVLAIGITIYTAFAYQGFANHKGHEKELIVVATSASFESESSRNWVNLLMADGIPAKHVTPPELDQYKKEKVIVVMGGMNEPGGIDEIIRSLLTKEELEWVSQKDKGNMYVKNDVWDKDQTIIIFAGYDRDAAQSARADTRAKWEILIKRMLQ